MNQKLDRLIRDQYPACSSDMLPRSLAFGKTDGGPFAPVPRRVRFAL